MNPFIRLTGNTKTNLPTEDAMLDSSDGESDSANLREDQDSLQMDDDDLSESDSIVVKKEGEYTQQSKGKGCYFTEAKTCFRSESTNTKAAETKIYDETK